MRFSFIHRSLIPAALGLSLFVAGSARSQQASLYIQVDDQPPYTNPFKQACNINLTAGIHLAQVVVSYSFDFSSVRFTAVVPPGAIFLNDALLGGGSFTGNSQTGIAIHLPTCVATENYAVLQITFLLNAPINNYTWTVGPAAGKATIELDDCDGFLMKGTGAYSIYCDKQLGTGPYRYPGPYQPYPPDGAVDVPLDATLGFVGYANEIGVADHPIEFPFQANVFHCGAPYAGPPPCVFPLDVQLQPNTTYYWQAINWCYGCEHGDYGTGDLWSFTTGDAPLAASKTTWGQVKAMYRE